MIGSELYKAKWKEHPEGRVCIEGTEEAEIADEIKPEPQDFLVIRRQSSGFFGTDLDILLREMLIDTPATTGLAVSRCVRATATEAFVCRYRVIVPEECVADRNDYVVEASLFDIDSKLGDVMPVEDVIREMQNVYSRS